MAPQMRKRDKKKEKAKAEAALKKRKELYVDVKLGAGPGDKGKRGAGRRQRVSHSVKWRLRFHCALLAGIPVLPGFLCTAPILMRIATESQGTD
jgi:hypothetical protein